MMNRRKLLQQFGVALLVLLAIGCAGERDLAPGTVTGEIDMGKNPLPSGVKLLMNVGDLDRADIMRNLDTETIRRETRTSTMDANGQFAFDDVAAGTHRLYFFYRFPEEISYVCWTGSPDIEMHANEIFVMETSTPITFGMLSDPFEVGAGEEIIIDVHCARRGW
jgi:hypothetical protein